MTNEARDRQPPWEAALNRWLDGELDAAGIADLEARAASDPDLATALAETAALKELLGEMPAESAPAGLRRRLLAIPPEQTAAHWWPVRPAWRFAFAVIPLLAIGFLWLTPEQPTQAEVQQARRDLAVALAYLERASVHTSQRVDASLHRGMARPVIGAVGRSLEDPLPLPREADL